MDTPKIKIELTPYQLLRLMCAKKFCLDAIADPFQQVSEFHINATKEAFEELEKQFFAKTTNEQIDDAIAQNEVNQLLS